MDFFLKKTKDVIDVFKEEQIHIIDAYTKMRMEETKQQVTIIQLNKKIEWQELMIQQMSTFIHDALDIIFDIVERKEEVIRKRITLGGSMYYRYEDDPFRLY